MNQENLSPVMQQSDKITTLVKPIADQFEKGNLTQDDLSKIGKAIQQLSDSHVSRLWEPITDAKAKEMIETYAKEFSGDIVMPKAFKISYKLLSDLIAQQKDLILKFVQLDIELNLLYQDADGNQRLLINTDTSMLLEKDAQQAFYRNFYDPKTGLMLKLDASITRMFNDASPHQNTRQITIPYKTNFDQFDPEKYSGIVLIPAIDNNTENLDRLNKINFVMYFEEFTPNPTSVKTYYDVFTPCPPGDCFPFSSTF